MLKLLGLTKITGFYCYLRKQQVNGYEASISGDEAIVNQLIIIPKKLIYFIYKKKIA